MTWTFPKGFEADDKGNVGTLVAVWNQGLEDEFVFQGSVNIDSQDSLNDYSAKANATLTEVTKGRDAETKPEESPHKGALETLAATMNSSKGAVDAIKG